MNVLGIHILLDLARCDKKILKSPSRIRKILTGAAKRACVTIVETVVHEFNPQGVSGVVVIAESHISIHTWPEYNAAAVDIFTCGDQLQPEAAAKYIIQKLGAKKYKMDTIHRGTACFLAVKDKT